MYTKLHILCIFYFYLHIFFIYFSLRFLLSVLWKSVYPVLARSSPPTDSTYVPGEICKPINSNGLRKALRLPSSGSGSLRGRADTRGSQGPLPSRPQAPPQPSPARLCSARPGLRPPTAAPPNRRPLSRCPAAPPRCEGSGVAGCYDGGGAAWARLKFLKKSRNPLPVPPVGRRWVRVAPWSPAGKRSAAASSAGRRAGGAPWRIPARMEL